VNVTQHPELTLKKKSNSICYHAVCESAAMGKSFTEHCPTNNNMADLATKCIGGGIKCNHLSGMILHDIVDEPVA
jgi:hypothetical protein